MRNIFWGIVMVYGVSTTTNDHCMTITDVIEYSDDVKDLVDHNTRNSGRSLRRSIQSWRRTLKKEGRHWMNT